MAGACLLLSKSARGRLEGRRARLESAGVEWRPAELAGSDLPPGAVYAVSPAQLLRARLGPAGALPLLAVSAGDRRSHRLRDLDDVADARVDAEAAEPELLRRIDEAKQRGQTRRTWARVLVGVTTTDPAQLLSIPAGIPGLAGEVEVRLVLRHAGGELVVHGSGTAPLVLPAKLLELSAALGAPASTHALGWEDETALPPTFRATWALPLWPSSGDGHLLVAARQHHTLARHAPLFRTLAEAAARALAPARARALQSDRPSLLVVEDDDTIRELMAEVLGDRYRVHVAHDAEEAERLALADPPDAVLEDLGLPDADGLTLLRRLHNHPQLSTVPVIIVSGRDAREERVRALEHGAVDYLVKPFDLEDLLLRLERLLEGRRRRLPGRAAELAAAQ